MRVLLIFNKEPYDGTDLTWNGLRLANQLHEDNHEVRIFMINDSVDLARDINIEPQGYDQDLSGQLKDLVDKGVEVKACGTCMTRCGIYKNKPYFSGVEKSTMKTLSKWIIDSDRVINL